MNIVLVGGVVAVRRFWYRGTVQYKHTYSTYMTYIKTYIQYMHTYIHTAIVCLAVQYRAVAFVRSASCPVGSSCEYTGFAISQVICHGKPTV